MRKLTEEEKERKRNESILKLIESIEDLESLFNFYKTNSGSSTAKKFNISIHNLNRILNYYGIEIHSSSESAKLSDSLKKATKLEKYGDANYNNKDKNLQTKKERYGSIENAYKLSHAKGLATFKEKTGYDHPFQQPKAIENSHSPEAIAKKKQTQLERYGDENYNNRPKARRTTFERYGVELIWRLDKYQNKARESCRNNLGVDYPLQNREIYLETVNSCFNHYGVSNPFAAEEVKELLKSINLKKYGVEYYFQSDQHKKFMQDNKDWIKEKEIETKKRNGTLNTSTPEKDLEIKLKEFYGEDDVETQYKCDRYPFHCDFYIKSRDLFIELNYFWMHGPHPYDDANEEDRAILESWKLSLNDHEAYKTGVYVWSDLDVKKIETAKRNNLNYIAIYPSDDIVELLFNMSEN